MDTANSLETANVSQFTTRQHPYGFKWADLLICLHLMTFDIYGINNAVVSNIQSYVCLPVSRIGQFNGCLELPRHLHRMKQLHHRKIITTQAAAAIISTEH